MGWSGKGRSHLHCNRCQLVDVAGDDQVAQAERWPRFARHGGAPVQRAQALQEGRAGKLLQQSWRAVALAKMATDDLRLKSPPRPPKMAAAMAAASVNKMAVPKNPMG